MLELPREETEGKLQMLLSLRKNGLTSLFKEVRVFKGPVWTGKAPSRRHRGLNNGISDVLV